MKKIILILALLAIAGAIWWWLGRPIPTLPLSTSAATTPTQAVQVIIPSKSLAPLPAATVEAPKVTPAPLAPGVDARDPQENLDTALADVIRLAQANDFLTLFATYGAPLVDPKSNYYEGGNIREGMQNNVQSFQAYIQSPGGQAERERMQAVLAYLKTQTPVYNAAGDQATFQYRPTTAQDQTNGLSPIITFAKKDGRWFIQTGNPFGW